MFKKFLFVVAALTLIGGCKSKTKTAEDGSAAGIESTALSFDPQGSDSGKIDGLKTIYFGYDQSSLTSEAQKVLRANAQWMKSRTQVKIQIEGHCDSRGTIEYNVALGERRANTVKNYLIGLGISEDRLSTISYGKEKPIAMGDSDADMARNRRANFVPFQ
jgi:peptidoglycan-associated lipoprotein